MQLLFDLRIGLIPLLIKGRHRGKYLFQLFFRRHAGPAVPGICIRMSHVKQASYPDHKKLIQIAGKDRYKFHPLQQRHTLILCFFKDSLVKLQPGKFPVLCIV